MKAPKFDPKIPKLYYLEKCTGGPFSNLVPLNKRVQPKNQDEYAARIQRAFRMWKARKEYRARVQERELKRQEQDLLAAYKAKRRRSSICSTSQKTFLTQQQEASNRPDSSRAKQQEMQARYIFKNPKAFRKVMRELDKGVITPRNYQKQTYR